MAGVSLISTLNTGSVERVSTLSPSLGSELKSRIEIKSDALVSGMNKPDFVLNFGGSEYGFKSANVVMGAFTASSIVLTHPTFDIPPQAVLFEPKFGSGEVLFRSCSDRIVLEISSPNSGKIRIAEDSYPRVVRTSDGNVNVRVLFNGIPVLDFGIESRVPIIEGLAAKTPKNPINRPFSIYDAEPGDGEFMGSRLLED